MYRLGRFCARHRFLVLGIWIALAAAVILVVSRVGAETNNQFVLPGTDSQRAFDILAQDFPPEQNGSSPILFKAPTGKVTDTRYKRAIEATHRRVKAQPKVYSAVSPFSEQGQGQISEDGRIAFISVLLTEETSSLTEKKAQVYVDAVEPATEAGMDVAVGGPIGSALSPPDTGASDEIGIIAAMILLTLVFGSLVAMTMPILTAIIALAVGLSLMGLLGHAVDVPTVATTLATMIGLGVGIDYALFLVSRHRDQLRDGVEMRESIARADATSGRAILFAGGTVVAALVSLMVAGIPLVTSLGYSAALVVVTAMAGAITLLIAIMSVVGKRITSLRTPAFLRPKPKPLEARRWTRWAGFIARHPVVAIVLALLILLPLSLPVFSLELGTEDIAATSPDTQERQAYDLMSEGFGPGYNGPLVLAVSLGTKATPSEKVTRQENELRRLQKELKREQRQGKKQSAALEEQADELEEQKAELEAEAAELEAEAIALEADRDRLEREASHLRTQAERLIRQAAPLVRQAAVLAGRLVVLERRIARVQEAIQRTTDPDRRARLQARLARLQQRAAEVRAELAAVRRQAQPLIHRAEQLVAEAEALERQKAVLEERAAQIEIRGAQLQRQGARLEQQATALQAQKAELEALQAKAEKQQKRAENLYAALTKELTKAGGDDRGTDPRLVTLQDALAGPGEVAVVTPPRINDPGTTAIFGVIPHHDPASERTADLVRVLRSSVVPGATEGTDLEAFVGGTTASNIDLATEITSKLPLVILVVVGLSFLILLVAFRSLTVPIQAAITILLCVIAAFGILTAAFQWGWAIELIGIDTPRSTVPIASFVPLMMFAVLFGLSMDYEVFLVSHVREAKERGGTARDGVIRGLGESAPVITSAALIMIAVFGSFIINGDPTVKQFGVGLTAAVALAGTMMLLLAPAMFILLGERTWWLPRWLGKILPHVDIEGSVPKSEPERPGAERTHAPV